MPRRATALCGLVSAGGMESAYLCVPLLTGHSTEGPHVALLLRLWRLELCLEQGGAQCVKRERRQPPATSHEPRACAPWAPRGS